MTYHVKRSPKKNFTSVQAMPKATWEYSTQVLLERRQEERGSNGRKDRLVEGPHLLLSHFSRV